MSETKDLYETLHLHPSAHPDVIQAAYRRLALLYHPDKNPSPEATDMMAAVNRAYEVLGDPEKRAEYDRGRTAQSGAPASSMGTGPSAASTSQTSRPQSSAPRNPTGYFSLGSTKSDVADIHGPPDNMSIDQSTREEVWHYGSNDTIEFDLDSGKVQGWSNIRGNLRIRLVPGPNDTNAGFFTVGSHRDQVSRLHGTPPVLLVRQEDDWENWMYPGMMPDINHIEFSFSTGCVTGWENNDGSLKARPISRGPIPSTSTRTASARVRTSASRASNWITLSNEYNNPGIVTFDPVGQDYGLIIRFSNGELQLYVLWGIAVSHSATTRVSYQIDDGPVWSQSWGVSTDSLATYLPAHDVLETIRALFDASVFTARAYPFGGNPVIASFGVRGFRKAVAPILDAWRRAGSPAPGHTAQPGCLPFLLPVGALGAGAVVVPAIWFAL